MVDVVAHAALPGFAGTNHRKQERFFGEEILVPTLTFRKRHTHTDVHARERLTLPEVQPLRKATNARRAKPHPRPKQSRPVRSLSSTAACSATRRVARPTAC
jgi:hypothetical protein